MQRSSLQLVFRIADNRPPITEIERYMASFATLLIHARGEPALLGNCVNPPDEFVSSHGESIGHLCPKCNLKAPGKRTQMLRPLLERIALLSEVGMTVIDAGDAGMGVVQDALGNVGLDLGGRESCAAGPPEIMKVEFGDATRLESGQAPGKTAGEEGRRGSMAAALGGQHPPGTARQPLERLEFLYGPVGERHDMPAPGLAVLGGDGSGLLIEVDFRPLGPRQFPAALPGQQQDGHRMRKFRVSRAALRVA